MPAFATRVSRSRSFASTNSEAEPTMTSASKRVTSSS